MKYIEPAFKNYNSCIVLSSNEDFMPCVAVMIKSILEQANEKERYDILVLHKDVLSSTQQAVCQMADVYSNAKIRFVNVSEYLTGRSFYTENRNTITEETYFRLFLPWILSPVYQKALYVDGDMIVRKDIAPLLHLEMGTNLIAAVKDYWGICNYYIPNDSRVGYWKKIGINDPDLYVIAGTILFNLNEFRVQYTLEKVLDLAQSRSWVQHDQDVINILAQGHILHISPVWGYMEDYGNNFYLPDQMQKEVESAKNDPVIVHFGGVRKPWNTKFKEYVLDFWRYAERTSFFSSLMGKISNATYKNFIAYTLSKGNLDVIATEKGFQRFYKDCDLGFLHDGPSRYDKIVISNGTLHIEGLAAFQTLSDQENLKVLFRINGTDIPVEKQWTKNGYYKDGKQLFYRGEKFELNYPLDKTEREYTVQLICLWKGKEFLISNFSYGKFAPLSQKYKYSYYTQEDWAVTTGADGILVRNCSKKETRILEKKFCSELLATKKSAEWKAIVVRNLVRFIRAFLKQSIWLVSDRVSKADDNGEAFFKYLAENADKNIIPYFIISKGCKDYERLKKYGRVVSPYSYRHKILHLLADVSLSSQTDEIYRNPFRGQKEPYKDYLSRVKFVFLQHGIIYVDLSRWLCRENQQMDGFVLSTPQEYNSIFYGNYDYTNQQLWLTGLPRFDLLQNNPQKIITILPTWRRYLATGQNSKTGAWNLKPEFQQSEYAQFYRNLMQNPKLRACAEKTGYTLQFKIHPSFLANEKAFGFDEKVIIINEEHSYREVYAESDLIVTDYSSSISDFSYLKKPIVYCQFDKEKFFDGNHMGAKGFFNYETDGFGEVEYTLEATVNRIIEYMENGCQLKPLYRQRIEEFFAFHDRNNCARVYQKTCEMLKKQ